MLEREKKNTPSYKLEGFEGPLDLLLSLIAKNEMDIHDIRIAVIFEQYNEYLDLMREMDMEIAGEFLTMAAELMLIKSRLMLPTVKTEEGEVDPRADLAARLIAYQTLKEAKGPLSALYEQFSGRMVKETDEIDVDRSFVLPHELDALMCAFERIETRQRILAESRNTDIESSMNRIVVNKTASIGEKAISVLRILKKKRSADFESILLTSKTRSEIIALFFATLQLIGRRLVYISGENENKIPVLEINYDRRKEYNKSDSDDSAAE